METVEEYQVRRRAEILRAEDESRKTGIICPHCENEMINPHPGGALMSNPPQITVCCPECEYQVNVLA